MSVDPDGYRIAVVFIAIAILLCTGLGAVELIHWITRTGKDDHDRPCF